MNDESERPFAKRHRGLQSRRGEERELDNEDRSGDDCREEDRPQKYVVFTSMEKNPYQDDMKWTVSEVSDMCIPDVPVMKNTVVDMAYFDENTWDQRLVKEAARFKKLAREKRGRSGNRRWRHLTCTVRKYGVIQVAVTAVLRPL